MPHQSESRLGEMGSRGHSIQRILIFLLPLLVTSSAAPGSSCSSSSGSGISGSATGPAKRCLHYLRSNQGHFSTPNFPGPFPYPLDCSWVIDASSHGPDPVIILYMTQMYLTKGVQVVEYNFHNETLTKGRRDKRLRYLERPVSLIRFRAKFVEVHVSVQDLINANLRIQDRLINVYGFNITYEIQTTQKIKHETCNTFNCSFNGHCYASANYSHFFCSCLPGFHGRYCEEGPECDSQRGINRCQNGGTCKYIYGSSLVRCHCPPNYNGSACEYRREVIPAEECYNLTKLNCSHHCVVNRDDHVTCGCPSGLALKQDNTSCYKLTPKRLLVELEIAAPATQDRSQLRIHLEDKLRELIDRISAKRLSMGAVNFVSDSGLKFHLWSSQLMVNSSRRSVWNTSNFNSSRLQRTSRGALPAGEDKQWPSAVNTTISELRIRKHYCLSGQMVDNQCIAGIAVQILNVSFEEIQTLLIESIEVDVSGGGGRLWEGSSFTVSCRSSGSEKLQVRWFKDGIPIDPHKSLREMHSAMVGPNLLGLHTAYLSVKKATVMDRGEYECRVADWDQQAAKSVFLDVVSKPQLEIVPSAVYLTPGSALTITCRDDNDLARRTRTSYTWLRDDRAICQSRDEFAENLYPVGSLLKVNSLQNSAVYICRAQNEAGTADRRIPITLVENSTCPRQNFIGIEWFPAFVGTFDVRKCPPGYHGYARRLCKRKESQNLNGQESNLQETDELVWDMPDFSHCVPKLVQELESNWTSLTLGYSRTSLEKIINDLFQYIETRLMLKEKAGAPESLADLLPEPSSDSGTSPDVDLSSESFAVLPGEGTSVVQLISSMTQYFTKKHSVLGPVFWNSSAVEFLKTIDGLLSMPQYYCSIPISPVLQSYFQLLNDNLPSSEIPNLRNIFVSIQRPSESITISRQKTPELQSILRYKKISPGINLNDNRTASLIFPPVFLIPGQGFNFSANNLTIPLPVDGFWNKFSREFPEAHTFCVLLPLRSDTSLWDPRTCTFLRGNRSHVFCSCSQLGTVSLAYRLKTDEDEPSQPKALLLPLTIAAASSSMILMTVLLSTMIGRWYYYKTCWAWLQIQLNSALLLTMATFFTAPKLQAVLSSTLIDFYGSTIVVMCFYMKLKIQNSKTPRPLQQRSLQLQLQLLGPSFVIPMVMSAVHGLVQVFHGDSYFQLYLWHTIIAASSASFLLFISVFLVIYSLLHLRPNHRQNKDVDENLHSLTTNRLKFIKRCLFLCSSIFIGVVLLISLIVTLQKPSLSAKEVAAGLMLILTLFHCAVSFFLLEIPRARSFWLLFIRNCCCVKFRERCHETVLMESPTRSTRLTNSESLNGNSSRPSASAQDSQDALVLDQVPRRSKRPSRTGPASLPLLQRAGLGPEVQRAFAEHDTETQSHHFQCSITQTHVLIDYPVHKTDVRPLGSAQPDLKDDTDSGLGPSGESQKTSGLEKKISLILRAFYHTKLKMTDKVFTVWNTSSFRSRHSTVSSVTTDHGADRSISVTTAETEMHSCAETISQTTIRRSRWSEDYGNQSDLSSSENSGPVDLRPFRGRCLIRCSPEKRFRSWRSSRRTTQTQAHCISDPQTVRLTSPKNCERCWHNPEVPACDLCIAAFNIGLEPTGPVFIRACAIIEKRPAGLDSSEYLDMDAAGSLAVKDLLPDPSYYNVLKRPQTEYSVEDSRKDRQAHSPLLSHSAPTTPLSLSGKHKDALRLRNSSSGRITRKYRLSLRNLVHSTLSLTHLPSGHKRLKDYDSPEFRGSMLTL